MRRTQAEYQAEYRNRLRNQQIELREWAAFKEKYERALSERAARGDTTAQEVLLEVSGQAVLDFGGDADESAANGPNLYGTI